MTNNQEKRCPLSYFKKLNSVIRKGFEISFEKVDYEEIAEVFKDISGAKIVAINLYNEEKTKSRTIAFSGKKNILSKAGKILGITLEGKEWKIMPKRLKYIQKRELSEFSGLYEAGFGEIKKRTASTLEKIFNLGNVYVFRITHKGIIGDILLVFKKGEEMEEQSRKILGLFCEQLGFSMAQSDLQKTLEKDKSRYEEMMKQSKAFIWEIDKNGKYTYVSDNVKEVTGYSPKELVNKKTVFDLHPKRGREELQKTVLGLFKKKKSIREFNNPIEKKSGEIIWVFTAGTPVLKNDGELIGYRGTDTDITDIKEKEEKYQTLFDESPISKIIHDKKTGEIINANRKAFESYGFSSLEELQKNDFWLDPPYSKKEALANIKKAAKEGVQEFEWKNIKKNGEIFWEQAKLIPIKIDGEERVLATTVDITERKKLEDKIKEKEEQYRTIVSNLEGVVYRCLPDKKWTMLFINEHIEKLTGYPAEDFIKNKKRTFGSVIYKEDRSYVEKDIDAAIRKKQPWDLEYRVITKNGEERWVQENGVCILEKGKVKFLDGVIIDITGRKEMEENLKEAQKKAKLGKWDLFHKEGRLEWSDTIYEIFEIDPEKFGASYEAFLNAIHPEDRESVNEAFTKSLKDKKPYKIEHRLLMSDGRIKWVREECETKFDKNGKPIVSEGVVQDITESKNAEIQIKEKGEQFEVAVKGSNDGIWDWNLKTDDLYISPKWKEQLGYKDKELKNEFKTFENLLHPEDKERVLDFANRYLKGEIKNYEIEFRMLHKKGGFRWILARGAAVFDENGIAHRMAGSHTDITERKLAEKQILDKNRELEKFQMAVHGASDHIVITDADGICLYMNDAAEKITGYKKEEILGKKVGTKENWGGLMEKKVYKELWDIIKKKKQKFTGELQNQRKNGEKYIAKAGIAPILNEKGEVEFFVGIERDITKEKQVDTAKTEFVSLASHQLRTPLSTINWYLEMLLDGDAGKINKEQEKYLKEIHIGNQRMVELVNALLNVSRLELGTFVVEPEQVDVKEVSKSVIEELKPKIKEKKQAVKESYSRALPKIKADPKLMRIILQNLLSNAVKYSPEKGKVEIEIKKVGVGKSVDGRKAKKDSIFIKVSDNGYGIPKTQHNKVFSKLFRADNIKEKESEGTGLGLYIVKEIVEHSGGEIWFKSDKDKGTTFYLTLPTKGMKKKEGTKGLD